MNELVTVDTSFFDCAMIDTDTWLEKVTDSEVTDVITEHYPKSENTDDSPFWGNEYDRETLAKIAARYLDLEFDPETKSPRDNTCNSDNAFSSDFVFEIFPEDNSDWLYSRCLIAINPHLGGDPRGNYGGAQFFIVDCPAESGFCDWGLDLYITLSNGDNADDEGIYTSGYQSAPEYAFENDARVVGYSEKRKAWLAWFKGRAVAVYFEARAGLC